ncbi:hypothetical protein F5Y16DRAFT_249588 [Xylariaceae sp. FL0255]|nr:hypothetical protein F5Y16DRAFT_249588 [Xylariaceae sp. FL0255]
MFRDESTKVMQKAHAQWGTSDSATEEGSERSSPSDQNSWAVFLGPSPTSMALSSNGLAMTRIPRRVEPNLDQRGIQFFVERYLLNHPDSPNTPALRDAYMGDGDAIQNVMIAVGLAGMSNLLGNKSMNLVARSKYITALKQTGQLIASATRDPKAVNKPLMSIVTLALFEVVQGKGSKVTAGSANTHINGAVALARSALPVAGAPDGGARGVLQLMFSMLIPSQMTETPLPPGFFECLKLCKKLLSSTAEDFIVDIAALIARLIHLLLSITQTAHVDDQPPTDSMIQQLLLANSGLDHYEGLMICAFPFVVHQFEQPSPAIFRGKWHKYEDIWGARIWNHLRWARLLLANKLVEIMAKYPMSSARFISPKRTAQFYTKIERTAKDLLRSTPSHWHHPALEDATAKRMAAAGKGGAGAAGLPTLLWHLVIAGCAPNVPPDFWDWGHECLQVVWRSMGMQHAVALSEVMEEHRKTLQETGASNAAVIQGVLAT